MDRFRNGEIFNWCDTSQQNSMWIRDEALFSQMLTKVAFVTWSLPSFNKSFEHLKVMSGVYLYFLGGWLATGNIGINVLCNTVCSILYFCTRWNLWTQPCGGIS